MGFCGGVSCQAWEAVPACSWLFPPSHASLQRPLQASLGTGRRSECGHFVATPIRYSAKSLTMPDAAPVPTGSGRLSGIHEGDEG